MRPEHDRLREVVDEAISVVARCNRPESTVDASELEAALCRALDATPSEPPEQATWCYECDVELPRCKCVRPVVSPPASDEKDGG